MKDFSLEEARTKISSDKTKEYIGEVLSSYYNGNNRAAIVTLFSVVICDILDKLEVLDEIYQDTVAKDILDEIKAFQTSSPTNPDWEKDIIEKVKNRTDLIDNTDYTHIKSLQNHRHLCAHPVINKDDKLYTPNKETVASHIRNMMESLFLKPPILSKKLLGTILEDIADKKSTLIDDPSLEKYLVSKYLSKINVINEVSMFRDLWKFVFKLTNSECDENRLINYRFLYILYKRNIAKCIQKIKSEIDYFNNINNGEVQIKILIRFLSESEFLYLEFRADIQLLIKSRVKTDLSAKFVAWFLEKDFLTHLKAVKQDAIKFINHTFKKDASSAAYQRLFKIGVSKGFEKDILDFIVWRYSNSKNYADADDIFTAILLPYLDQLNKDQLIELCALSEKNAQVYDRNQAEEDHLVLKKKCEVVIGTLFLTDNYPNVFKKCA